MAYIDDVSNVLQIQPNTMPTFVRLSQNENGRKLYFKLVGNEANMPSGAVVTISGTKPDGVVYSATGSISNNIVTINEDTQLTAVAGIWDAKIKITSGGNTVATGRIRFVIDADTVAPGSVPSDSQLEGLVAEAQAYVEEARGDAYGSPLTAGTVAEMTDTTRVYVYTGSETGYTEGDWYYWDGSAWTSGGVYNTIAIDDRFFSLIVKFSETEPLDTKTRIWISEDETEYEIPTSDEMDAELDSISIKSSKNLLNLGALQPSISGTNVTISDGIISGTAANLAGAFAYNPLSTSPSGLCPLVDFETNQQYTLSFKIKNDSNGSASTTGLKIRFHYIKNGMPNVEEAIIIPNNKTSYTAYTATSTLANGVLRGIDIKDANSNTIVWHIKELQLEKGTSATTYEPYRHLNEDDETIKSILGQIEELEDVVESIEQGLTNEVRTALLACFEHVAWIDEHGQDYYDALHDALYSGRGELDSITVVYTDGIDYIYTDDNLDTLRNNLVVTAHYTNESSEVVTEYELSGTLTVGTNNITVTYQGKTATFTVSVYTREYLNNTNVVSTVGFSGLTLTDGTFDYSSSASYSLAILNDAIDKVRYTLLNGLQNDPRGAGNIIFRKDGNTYYGTDGYGVYSFNKSGSKYNAAASGIAEVTTNNISTFGNGVRVVASIDDGVITLRNESGGIIEITNANMIGWWTDSFSDWHIRWGNTEVITQ